MPSSASKLSGPWRPTTRDAVQNGRNLAHAVADVGDDGEELVGGKRHRFLARNFVDLQIEGRRE